MKTTPNAQLTARPQIFFRVSREPHSSDDLIREMLQKNPVDLITLTEKLRKSRELEAVERNKPCPSCGVQFVNGKCPNCGRGSFEDFVKFQMEPSADVKEFTPDFLIEGTRENKEMKAATTEDDRKTLLALMLLLKARVRNEKDFYVAALLLAPGIEPDPKKHYSDKGKRKRFDRSKFDSHDWRETVSRLYPGLLNVGIRGRTQVGVTSDLVPAIYCDDLRTAVFVFAAYRGVEVCLGCHKLFAADPKGERKYHSPACGQRVWQKQYRLREKTKLKKRKGRR